MYVKLSMISIIMSQSSNKIRNEMNLGRHEHEIGLLVLRPSTCEDVGNDASFCVA